MKKILLPLILCFLLATQTIAQYSITVSNPHFNVNQRTQGIITSPEVIIEPTGAYARVEMTFTINPVSTYKSTDSLEAVLLFNMPEGSYINDSWLWLDEQHIIRADIVEKNRAIAIYEGIVKRRRDPSLLVKTGANSYQLNVYPMTTLYPRKVKLVYYTPIKYQHTKANVEVPTGLFAASQVLSDVVVKLKQNPQFLSPNLVEHNYSKYFLGASSNDHVLLLPGADYKNCTFTVSYEVPSGGLKMYTYPHGTNGGVYQLVIPPSSFGTVKTTNTVFVLDHVNNGYSINSIDEIKKYLKTAMLTDYSAIDSFNLFYVANGTVVQAFNSWENISAGSVATAMNGVPVAYSSTNTKYEDLLKAALSFCAIKPGSDAQVVLLSNSNSYTNNQPVVDGMFNNIKNAIGGQFSNKIHIVNYSSYRTYTAGAYYYANDIWYSKLSLATGGTLYKYQTAKSTYINGKYQTTYDLEVPEVLNTIANNTGLSTSSYNINVGVNNGFTYSSYNLNSLNRLNTSKYYVETGMYTGAIQPGNTVNIQAISGSNVINTTATINSVLATDSCAISSWTHHYLNELIATKNNSYVQEIIDSSINNRVLCEYTAFLAVETGDTIATNQNDNPNWLTLKDPEGKELSARCYPNPFTDKLIIEFKETVSLLEIYDITGRKILSVVPDAGSKSYVWNGADAKGASVPAGIYVIMASSPSGRFTTKVMKQ